MVKEKFKMITSMSPILFNTTTTTTTTNNNNNNIFLLLALKKKSGIVHLVSGEA